MELDDLKHAWRNNTEHADISAKDEHLKVKIAEIIRSKRGLASNILFELVTAAFIYVIVGVVMSLYFKQVPMFIIKLIIIIFLGTLPIYYRLYLSMQWLKVIDYGKDIKSNLEEFIRYHRTTMKVYQIGGYSLTVLLFIVFITDTSFQAFEFWVRASVLCYLVICALLIKPLINRFYGRKSKVFEGFLATD